MNRKLGEGAFAYYASLGTARSYERVAERFQTTKRAVSKAAKREGWPARVVELDRVARQKLEANAVESIEEMSDRHIKMARVIQSRALETLKSIPLNSAMNAVRALNLAIEIERITRGEPTERQAVSVEEVIRREYSRWLGPAIGGGSDGEEAPDETDEADEDPVNDGRDDHISMSPAASRTADHGQASGTPS